jgi:hypothetical protein
VTPPKWNDDEAMLALVDDWFLELEMLDALDDAERIQPDITFADVYSWIERDAVDAAKAGNFRPLVDMRRGQNPLVRKIQDEMGAKLSAEAEDLIDRRLVGERRVKEGRGVAKRSIAEREGSETFCAAQEVPAIEGILRHHFSGRRAYKLRAKELAAMRNGIQTDTLLNFMRKKREM